MNTPWPDSHIFWRDKRVVVTGGSGFLGSFVVDRRVNPRDWYNS